MGLPGPGVWGGIPGLPPTPRSSRKIDKFSMGNSAVIQTILSHCISRGVIYSGLSILNGPKTPIFRSFSAKNRSKWAKMGAFYTRKKWTLQGMPLIPPGSRKIDEFSMGNSAVIQTILSHCISREGHLQRTIHTKWSKNPHF